MVQVLKKEAQQEGVWKKAAFPTPRLWHPVSVLLISIISLGTVFGMLHRSSALGARGKEIEGNGGKMRNKFSHSLRTNRFPSKCFRPTSKQPFRNPIG